MKKRSLFTALLALAAGSFWMVSFRAPVEVKADADNAGLNLPAGFGALKVFETSGQARHLTVTPGGAIYVKLARLVGGKGILMLKDTNGDGKADEQVAFGNYTGTGVTLKNGYLYASSDQEVFRYKTDENGIVLDTENPEKIVTGLKGTRHHGSKSIVLDNANNLYVNVGVPSNSCQEKPGTPGSKGVPGCPLLDSAGGIWMFRADKANQTYADGTRFATGVRNVVGLDWNTQSNSLFVMQHGRDELSRLFPAYYDSKQSAELPAECMYELKKGDNAGWPYGYYDNFQKKLMLAPEYGGDGKIEADKKFIRPVAAFPAHTAPNGMLFYTGNQFPAKYKNGAFIVFHGSWNRAPEPQLGYYVVFQPFKDGKPSGNWEMFADGFSGSPEKTASGRADHKPCGIAQGADGSIYITDDLKGSVYRIVYAKK